LLFYIPHFDQQHCSNLCNGKYGKRVYICLLTEEKIYSNIHLLLSCFDSPLIAMPSSTVIADNANWNSEESIASISV